MKETIMATLMAPVFMICGCCAHKNYNSPKMTFDNPPSSGYDCTAVFTGNPDKMVITCVDKPASGEAN